MISYKIKGILNKILPNVLFKFINLIIVIPLKIYNNLTATGYIKSIWHRKAVNKNYHAIPWYTYSALGFLSTREYNSKNILEFGAGQSTLWWSNRANKVVSFENDVIWYNKLKAIVNKNVDLHYINIERSQFISEINNIIKPEDNKFDVIVIDGLYREDLISNISNYLSPSGVIICDNSEGYEIYDRTKNQTYKRVDFFGSAPGVLHEQNTSIFFGDDSFIFNPKFEIQKNWNLL